MNHESFWKDFQARASDLASLFREGKQEWVFNVIENLLASHGFDFCFDITVKEGVCQLILSPEGDYQTAMRIDSLIESSPKVNGWMFWGRRQPKSLQDVRAIIKHLYMIDLFDCRFAVTFDNDATIEVFLPPYSDITTEEGIGLGNTLLWHLIGEDTVMKQGIRCNLRIGIMPMDRTLTIASFIQKCQAHWGGTVQ